MNALKAHVENGQIVLDEPAELAEGTKLFVVVSAHGDDDEMSAEERAELEAALDESLDDFEAGRVVDGASVRAMLRAIG